MDLPVMFPSFERGMGGWNPYPISISASPLCT